MKFIFFWVLFVFVFFACESKKKQVIDLDDVTKGSADKFVPKYVEKDTLNRLKLSDFSKCLISELKLNETFTHTDSAKSEFLQRFHPIQSEHWKNQTKNSWLNYYHWKFKDSVVAYTAFYNWLDQFDSNQSIQLGEQKKVSKNSLLLLVQYCSVVKIEMNSVLNLEELVEKLSKCGFGKSWDIVMYQPKSKKINWFTKSTNGQLVPKEFEKIINE